VVFAQPTTPKNHYQGKSYYKMVVRFYFLGAFDLRGDQQALLKPPTQKSQSLLAYLVLQRKHPLSRDHLINLFWGERPEHKARRSLTTALWHIRNSLPADFIISDYSSVQLNPQAKIWVDVDEFSRLVYSNDPKNLATALNLYRGTLLDSFYDDWVMNERYRIEADYEEALARLMLIQQNASQYQQALHTAQRLVEHDPLREDAYRVVIQAYCRLGQPQAALKQYQRLCQILEQELGVDPASETRELYHKIREVSLAGETAYQIPVEEQPNAGMPVWGKHPLETPGAVRFVGRKSELDYLDECWQTVRSGYGKLVLISGEAGVGKSRLVEEFSKQKRWQGVEVLYGRCYEFERMLPYQPVIDALHSILLFLSKVELESLPNWVIRELAHLVPELAERTGKPSYRLQESWEQERNQLFAAILAIVISLGTRGGRLLVIEDLHWASEATLQLLHYLVRNLDETAVLIVGTFRLEGSSERQPALEMVDQLEREDLAKRIQLAPLRQGEIEQLVMEMSGGGAEMLHLAQWLYLETEGNPFFLMESVKALFEAGMLRLEEGTWQGDFQRMQAWKSSIPAGISQLIQNRIQRLDEASLETLTLAAVIGREFDFDLLCAAQGQGEETTLTAIDKLLRSRIIEEGRNPVEPDYIFSHHKFQEVVYQTIPARRKSRMHDCVAQTLERMYPEQPARLFAELAFHYLRAGRQNHDYIEKSIAYSIAAGDQARILYAHHEAIDHYQQALSLLDEERDYERAARTLMKIVSTHHNAFDFKGVQKALDDSFKMRKRAARQQSALQITPANQVLKLPWQDPLSLDPAKAFNVYAWGIIKHLFSRLVEFGPDKEVIPDIAKTWQVMEDGRKYVFQLRKDVRWSDGTILTAVDFAYAWKRLLDPSTGWIHASLMYNIKGGRAYHRGETVDSSQVGVFAEDETTLVVELEEPACYFLSLLGYVCPVPRHIVEKLGDRWAEPENIVTNGAFLLKDCCRSEAISLVRNPDYHGTGRGNVQEVRLDIVPNQDWSNLLHLYQQEALHALDLTTFPSEAINNIRSRYSGEFLSGPDLLSYNLGFDVSRPPFNDRRVRLAFAMAIDREFMIGSLFNNYALVANGGFVPPGMPGHSSNIGLPYDPEQAQRLLAEAGYPGGRGFPKVDALYLDNPYRNPIGEYLRQQWLEILGIDSIWQVTGWEEYVSRILNQPPHISSMTWLAEYHTDPDDFLKVGMSHARIFTKWENERYDSLVKQAGRKSDQNERLKLYAQAERILIDEVALFPLLYGQIELLVKPYLKRFSVSHLSDWTFKDIWVASLPSEPGE
jgi:ABC-type oligopeptide transport system substrate-binding subunit/DNA-binding SARP family transcriptional activator